jgi:large subunit ribosomal protein L29
MKINEIREMQTPELIKRVADLKQELFTLKFQQATGQNNQVAKKVAIKKEIARILTVVRERELVKE